MNMFKHTIRNNEEVDAEYSEAFANLVVRILKLPLHDCCVDLDDDDAT